MMAQGKGLRILVGGGNHSDLLLVWVGDSDSNVGAIHDTVADQFSLSLYDQHVPLEMTPQGDLRITVTSQNAFGDRYEIEDVLDRNKEFQKIFGDTPIDYSKINEGGDEVTVDGEKYNIDVGDEIKIGKWKNKKATITGFEKDKNNHPVLKTTKGDQQLFKPRLTKVLNQ